MAYTIASGLARLETSLQGITHVACTNTFGLFCADADDTFKFSEILFHCYILIQCEKMDSNEYKQAQY